MARTALRRPSHGLARRSGPSPKLVKLQDRIKSLSKRARHHASSHEDLMIGVATAALVALAEKKHVKLPTVAGLDPVLLYGVAAYFLAGKVASGKNRHRMEVAGETMMAMGTARAVARGGVKVAGEDDEPDELDD